ncbi:MAG: succinate dehydrogenase / fumarate reductase cytochrome b subunit [Verrucomicrobiales bacterium]|jgi:succinate dehydrogenase / fumarate reductase cytochrome b subunit
MNLLESIKRFYASSVGKKLLVALSGAALLLFLLGHLVGNLLVYMGREAINDYAEFLHHSLHGAGVWIARFGLLGAVTVHVVATIHLVQQNRAARVNRYAFESTVKASRASRTMIISGVIILSFIIFHLLHFTILPGPGDKEYYDATADHIRPDVYGLVVRGFSNVFISLFYMVSMAFLCLHLSHGFASVFQTLGLRTEKSATLIQWAGYGYAAFIFFGNISIPLAVLLGFVNL